MWLKKYELLLKDPGPNAFQAAVDLKSKNCPQSIFKYREPSDYALDSLRRGYVWLSNPDKFNDAYDSSIMVDFSKCLAILLRKNIRASVVQQAFQDLLTEADVLVIERSENPVKVLVELVLKRDNKLTEGTLGRVLNVLLGVNQKHVRDLDEAWFALARKTIKVCSFSASGSLPTLWGYYAAENRGFCIEYDLTKLPCNDIRSRLLAPSFMVPHQQTSPMPLLPP